MEFFFALTSIALPFGAVYLLDHLFGDKIRASISSLTSPRAKVQKKEQLSNPAPTTTFSPPPDPRGVAVREKSARYKRGQEARAATRPSGRLPLNPELATLRAQN